VGLGANLVLTVMVNLKESKYSVEKLSKRPGQFPATKPQETAGIESQSRGSAVPASDAENLQIIKQLLGSL
jgi:hypothetical protein